MFNNVFDDFLVRLRDLGLTAIHYISEFGYNFFFKTINELLGTSFTNELANWTLFEAIFTLGIIVWVSVAVIRFFV